MKIHIASTVDFDAHTLEFWNAHLYHLYPGVPVGAAGLRSQRPCRDKLTSVKTEAGFHKMENENGLKEKPCFIPPEKLEFY